MTPEVAATLIERIATRHHAVHRQEMPSLIRLARLVEATHDGHHALTIPTG